MKSFTLLTLTLLTLLTLAHAIPPFSIRQPADSDTDGAMDTFPEDSPEESPEETTEQPAEDDDPICVDAAYLARLGHAPSSLVHRSHILANAFCPPNALPCGTRHHRLRLNGRDISYEQYCQQVACTRRLVEVNSVWTHVWQDRHLDGVVLTMMDHRWSEAPQKLLHRALSAVRAVVG